MNDLDSLKPTTEERVMAALSHITVLMSILGAVVPPIIWASEKEKSKYVTFQSLQASIYQLVLPVLYNLGGFVLGIATIFMMLAAAVIGEMIGGKGGTDLLILSMLLMFVFMGLYLLGYLALVVYGVVGAVLTAMGKPFRYLFIGKWVENFYAKNGSAADEQIASALSHISILIQYFGFLVPLIIWATQKAKSKQVAFQALQALVVQVIGVVVYFVGMGVYMVSYTFGMIGSAFLSSSDSSETVLISTLIFMLVIPMLVMLVMYLIMGALNIYAFVGTVRTARGKPFQYVIVGNWIKRLMQNKQNKSAPGQAEKP